MTTLLEPAFFLRLCWNKPLKARIRRFPRILLYCRLDPINKIHIIKLEGMKYRISGSIHCRKSIQSRLDVGLRLSPPLSRVPPPPPLRVDSAGPDPATLADGAHAGHRRAVLGCRISLYSKI
jgi:hypothetical protein